MVSFSLVPCYSHTVIKCISNPLQGVRKWRFSLHRFVLILSSYKQEETYFYICCGFTLLVTWKQISVLNMTGKKTILSCIIMKVKVECYCSIIINPTTLKGMKFLSTGRVHCCSSYYRYTW